MSTAALAIYNKAASEVPTDSLIRDGLQGNYDTVFQMVRLVRQTVNQKSFQDFVNQLFIDVGFNAHTSTKRKLKFIDKYVKQHITYAPDIAGRIESIKSADVTLSDGYGDCDDLSILYASLLGVLGFTPRFVLATYNPTETQFSHIYVELITGGERFVFDNAIPNGKFNAEITPNKTITIDIFSANETDSVQGIFKQVGMAFQNLYKNTMSAMPLLAGFSPLGIVAYMALSTGTGIASIGFNKNLSLNEFGSKIHRELDDIIKHLHNRQISDDMAELSALQIAAQLSSYKINNRNDAKNYKTISQSIKQKLIYITNYNTDNDLSKLSLNHNGMALLGALSFGAISYYTYKHFIK